MSDDREQHPESEAIMREAEDEALRRAIRREKAVRIAREYPFSARTVEAVLFDVRDNEQLTRVALDFAVAGVFVPPSTILSFSQRQGPT